MKRLIIIILIIVYITAVSVLDGMLIDKKSAVLDSKLEALYTLAENEHPDLKKAVDETELYWEENEFFFALVTNHRLTDELDEDILMLKHYVGINDEQHLMAKIAECRSMVQEIVKDDDFAWHNIF